MLDAISRGRSFVVEAGAGAGKTTSLIDALTFLIESAATQRWPLHQQVACITYTNVAKNEILARVDRHPLIFCSTIHGFCWESIKRFQTALRAELPTIGSWDNRVEKRGVPIAEQPVGYELGLPTITADRITVGHSDVPQLMVGLLKRPRFRTLLADRFPFILIDEYQDSDAKLAGALVDHFCSPPLEEDKPDRPVLGFFGDHWQQIYPGTCGAIPDTATVTRINKRANFRSAPAIVQVLNRMRPGLPQHPNRREPDGEVTVFHTNEWTAARQAGGQWDGDLELQDAKRALTTALLQIGVSDLEAAENLKVLMLTHRVLGSQQGYDDLVAVFPSLEGLSSLEDPHLEYFVETLEPLCRAYETGRYGEMFASLNTGTPSLRGAGDKRLWGEAMAHLAAAQERGTVENVMDSIKQFGLLPLPEEVLRREIDTEYLEAVGSGARMYSDLGGLRSVPYEQIKRFARFYQKTSPFATKHGVKGAEFDDVVVVVSRGWNNYDFNAMLELVPQEAQLRQKERNGLQRNRNLFYVACSRARNNLTLVFTHSLSEPALATLRDWFGNERVVPLPG